MKNLLIALSMSATAIFAADPAQPTTETATFGGGCFWCVEAQYKLLPGVKKVLSGYAGGHKENPTYEEVCEKTTGHAEVVQVEYDPTKVTYKEIIDLFWEAHDPTTLNRQGNDVGTQYRSAMFYTDDQQKAAFEAALERAKKHWNGKIVTEIRPLDAFYPAEDYHQDYFNKNPANGYCSIVIEPKIVKARAEYSRLFTS